MELRQMRYFVVLAEMLSFSRAAEVLYITQPTLSQQVSALERELGCALLTRDKRQVALTEQGKIFLEEARFLCTRASALEKAMQLDGENDPAKKVEPRIGVQTNCSHSSRIFRALMNASNRMTDEGLVTCFRFRSEKLETVRISDFDAFVCVKSRLLSKNLFDLSSHILGHDRLVLVFHSEDRKTRPVDFLASNALLVIKNEPQDISTSVQVFEQLGLPPHIAFVEDTASAAFDVCLGNGGLVLPTSIIPSLFHGMPLQCYELPVGVYNQFSIEFCWPDPLDKLMRQFCAYYEEALIHQPPDPSLTILPF